MTCPVCGGKTSVVNSVADCESVYRTRKCLECHYKFTTTEHESNDRNMLGMLKYQQAKEKNKAVNTNAGKQE